MKFAVFLLLACLCVSFIHAKSIKRKAVERTWGDVDAEKFARETIMEHSGSKRNTFTFKFPGVRATLTSWNFISQIFSFLCNSYRSVIESLAWNSSIVIHQLKLKLLKENLATKNSHSNLQLRIMISTATWSSTTRLKRIMRMTLITSQPITWYHF